MGKLGDGAISIGVKNIINPYKLYVDDLLTYVGSNENIHLTGLTSRGYTIKIIDANNKVVNKSIFLPRNIGIIYNLANTNNIVNGASVGTLTLSNISNDNSTSQEYLIYLLDNFNNIEVDYELTGDTIHVTGLTAGNYDVIVIERGCDLNYKDYNFNIFEPPSIITRQVDNIEINSTRLNGYADSKFGVTGITNTGFCFGTGSTPTITGSSATLAGPINGYFNSIAYGLIPNTSYNYRAYSINDYGLSYGLISGFTTLSGSIPSITIDKTSNLTTNSVNVNCSFIDYGGYDISSYGVCWSSVRSPIISDLHTTNAGFKLLGEPIFIFTDMITDLSSGITYYIRAYAINDLGISYSMDISITTTSTLTIPVVSTIEFIKINNPPTTYHGITTRTFYVKMTGEITYDGGTSITERGICWGQLSGPDPSGTHYQIAGASNPYTVTTTDFDDSLIYYFRTYAKNSQGVGYGEEYATIIEV